MVWSLNVTVLVATVSACLDKSHHLTAPDSLMIKSKLIKLANGREGGERERDTPTQSQIRANVYALVNTDRQTDSVCFIIVG